MKKTLWTLNIGNYAPELVKLTYPLLLGYAQKMGADFRIINARAFPDRFPVVYEKLQIYDIGRGNDWNVYVDSDALIFPDLFDVTERISKDTVAQYGNDHAGNRWRGDAFFRRDGRDIGSCNWFTAASDWCMDLWHPLDDIQLLDALAAIKPAVLERIAGIDSAHLLDDYVLSRNIARYGLKYKSVLTMLKEQGDPSYFVWHTHTKSIREKIEAIRSVFLGNGFHEIAEVKETRGMDSHDWLTEYGMAKPPAQKRTRKQMPHDGFVPQIRKAVEIYGWMSVPELTWLAEQAHLHKFIIEIGSFQGRSTRALADNTTGSVFAVDTWEGSPEHRDLPEQDEAESKFCENLKDHLESNHVHAIKMPSMVYAETRKGNLDKPDMVFIDAQHEYEAVKADILAWKQLIAPGGILCGHDFGDVPAAGLNPGEEWGVTRAVQELLPDYKHGAGSIWYVQL